MMDIVTIAHDSKPFGSGLTGPLGSDPKDDVGTSLIEMAPEMASNCQEKLEGGLGSMGRAVRLAVAPVWRPGDLV
jgi:hypothetical protein